MLRDKSLKKCLLLFSPLASRKMVELPLKMGNVFHLHVPMVGS